VVGIVRASDANVCIDNPNSTDCVPASTIITSNNDTVPLSNISDDGDPDEYLFWMAGATFCGLIFAVMATLSLWALEDAVQRFTK
jgi:hypothetical protein